MEEGLLIGRSTVTLATKNYLIVGALREGRSLHDLDLDGFVAEQLWQLSVEQDGYAARTARSARTARTAVGALRHQHDYRPADVKVLEERALIYSELARAFADLAADPSVGAELAESARADAWSELSSVIVKRLDLIARAAADPAYEGTRREGMTAVREVDLPTLEPDYRRWS